MSTPGTFDVAMGHLEALRELLEPDGGALDCRSQPPAKVRRFHRDAAAVVWCLGMSLEGLSGRVSRPARAAGGTS